MNEAAVQKVESFLQDASPSFWFHTVGIGLKYWGHRGAPWPWALWHLEVDLGLTVQEAGPVRPLCGLHRGI
ncbi:hypothetical protein Acr_00g0047160 [Actinidia rufa]|uniref:Uncharacterized protein n=1 Tax=Actinidia rufa TaxID=165716 RepID=A0A7J0DJR3_9ERIC|nr:hypothetical protein Acr_00g0047160 [Actinidia rufa]